MSKVNPPAAGADPPAWLEDLDRLEKQATPGPWKWGTGNSSVLGEDGLIGPDGFAVFVNCGRGSGDPIEEDIMFMPDLRNFAPRLIAIAKAAQEMAKTLDEVVRCIEHNMDCVHSGSDDGGDECDADDCIRCFVVGIGRASLEAYHKAVDQK